MVKTKEKYGVRNLIQCTTTDEPTIRRITRVQKARGHKSPARTIIDLALERICQLEQNGDPTALSQ